MKTPTVCRYCGGRIIKSTTRALYPKGSAPIYLCVNCNAYVGCYHELEKGVDKGSENLNDNEAHHSDGKKPSKSTRDIVKGDKQKSQADKNAKKKADSLKKEWEKAEENAKNSSKNFIEKNIDAIKDAVNAGGAVVVIGGVAYALWWILKIASGFGILIPV